MHSNVSNLKQALRWNGSKTTTRRAVSRSHLQESDEQVRAADGYEVDRSVDASNRAQGQKKTPTPFTRV